VNVRNLQGYGFTAAYSAERNNSSVNRRRSRARPSLPYLRLRVTSSGPALLKRCNAACMTCEFRCGRLDIKLTATVSHACTSKCGQSESQCILCTAKQPWRSLSDKAVREAPTTRLSVMAFIADSITAKRSWSFFHRAAFPVVTRNTSIIVTIMIMGR
jgi:hypothetical protein